MNRTVFESKKPQFYKKTIAQFYIMIKNLLFITLVL